MIQFIKCTAAQYAALVSEHTVNADNFYLLTDTDQFYLGERHLTDQDLSSYLTSISAKDNSITVTNNNQINVKISTKNGNNLSLVTESGKEGLYVNVPAATDYTVSIDETSGSASDPYSKRYTVKQGATGSQTTIGNIDIPKDMVVESGSVVNITYDNGKLYDGVTDVTSKIKGTGTATAADAGKYIKLVIANATSDIIYIAAKDLVDIYTAATGATQVQLAISGSNVISATLVDGGISTVKIADDAITTDKLADSIVTSLGKADTAVQSVTATGVSGNNGTITVDGSEVAVKGLGSAAYTASTAYATSAQGSKADTAVQSVTTGDSTSGNGTIKVDGTAVSVYGLGSAAYAATTDFDAAGSASTVSSNLIGTSGDAASANTIYGAKAYADSILSWTTLS